MDKLLSSITFTPNRRGMISKKALLRIQTLRLLSRFRVSGRFLRHSFALNDLDLKIEKYFPQKNGFFIELGANDGVSQTNTLRLEIFQGWNGVLIEPAMAEFSSLRKIRSKRNIFRNEACVSFQYKQATIELIYGGLMTTPILQSSDISNPTFHISQNSDFDRNKIQKFTAQASTLNSILDEVKAPTTIDFLSLDVEGAELEVLKGIDFSKYIINNILIESRNFADLNDFLVKFGYSFVEKLSAHDYFFKHIMSSSQKIF